jgi:hypothetical protein
MSLLNKASFLVTPNGYKEDKLYAAIPTNGNGDMTVTRATTATRVNESGLIELVPYNLLLRSEEFDNAAWTSGSVTATASSGVSPDGTNNAYLINVSVPSAHYLRQTITVTASTAYVFSFWAKRGTITNLTYSIYNSSAGANILSTDYYSQTNSSTWTRINIPFTTPVGCTSIGVYPIRDTPATGTFYLYGTQLVEGSSALTYQKTVDRLDIPRIDYTGGGCPSILLEPQRTNLIPYSEDFSNAAWNKSGISVNSDSSTSPSGDINSDEIVENSVASTQHRVNNTVTISSGLNYSITCYVKRGVGSRNFSITSVPSGIRIYFDLTDGTVGTETNGTGEIKSLGNGWFRCIGKGTSTDTSTPIYLQMTNGTTTSSETYDGDGVSSLYIWGAQIEQGSYPTSYIPNFGTALGVTRNADVLSKTGISDLLNPSEGTFYAEISALSNDLTNRILSLSDGTGDNNVQIRFSNASNQIRLDTYGAGASYRSTVTVLDTTENHKVLIKWGASGIFGFIDGDKYTLTIASGTGSGIPAALDRINFSAYFGGAGFYGKCKGVQVYKTALSDPQCQALTTL